MIPLEKTVAILLCAGLSRRYGAGNKLLALLDGKPLAAHVAALCVGIPFAERIAVVPPEEPPLHALLLDHGFDLVVNPDPASGKDNSLRLGLDRALDPDGRAAVILLGDMPHVTEAHLRALSHAATDTIVVISYDGTTTSPPTLLPVEAARLILAKPDRPVRSCLRNPVQVAASGSTLLDYDHAGQFDKYQ